MRSLDLFFRRIALFQDLVNSLGSEVIFCAKVFHLDIASFKFEPDRFVSFGKFKEAIFCEKFADVDVTWNFTNFLGAGGA